MESVRRITPMGLLGRMLLLAAAAALALACSDTVEPPPPPPTPVASVAVDPATMDLTEGESIQLKAATRSASGDTLLGRPVVWLSLDTNVVKVSATGVVSARAAGQTQVLARSEQKQGSALIRVRPPAQAPLITTLEPATVSAGGGALTVKIIGTGFHENSRVMWNDRFRTTTYVSPNEVRAAISAEDVANAMTVQVNVYNFNGGLSNPKTFAITAVAQVASVQVEPDDVTLWLGETVELQAIPRDAQGRPVQSGTIVWSTRNSFVAAVSASGLVTGTGRGWGAVRAETGGKHGDAVITVMNVPTWDVIYQIADWNGAPTLYITTPGSAAAPRRLLPEGMIGLDPAVSRDGNRVAFVGVDATGNRDIYVINRDGSNLRRVTTNPAPDEQPAWAPGGSKLAFQSFRNGYRDIFTINIDGSNEKNLTEAQYRFGVPYASYPSFSPDGTKIVFAQSDLATQPAVTRLFLMNADGTDLMPLHGTDEYSRSEPEFAPIGDVIAYRRSHPQHGSQIEFMRSNGESIYHINNPGHGYFPVWSPDGAWLAFVSGTDISMPTDVFVTQLGEVGRKQVTPGGGVHPAFIRR